MRRLKIAKMLMIVWPVLSVCVPDSADAGYMGYIDGESASIDSDGDNTIQTGVTTDDWELHDNGYTFLMAVKGEPCDPWITSGASYAGTKSIGYDIYPTVYSSIKPMDKVMHCAGYPAQFAETNYAAFAFKLSTSHFQVPTNGCLFAQWWQGTPHNPPFSIQFVPGSDPVQFYVLVKDDETGSRTAESCRVVFQGELSTNDWNYFVVKSTMKYYMDSSSTPGSIEMWHNGKYLSSLVNSGNAYIGYCGYKPEVYGGLIGAADGMSFWIGLYRTCQYTRQQVFFDEVEVSTSRSVVQTSVEEERFEPGINIEAENTAELVSPMVIATNNDAYGGKYIWVPEGVGNYAASNGMATYTFDIGEAGPYYLWARVFCSTSSSDSSFCQFDSGERVQWDFGAANAWIWQRMVDPVYLSTGAHTLTMSGREDGTIMDCFHIGTLFQTPPVEREGILMEAENGKLTAPMEVCASNACSAGYYIMSPNGTGGNNGGKMEYTFRVSASGYYYLWGLGYAATGNDDSFYISWDGETDLAWDFVEGAGWDWKRSNAHYLVKGDHTVTIKVREDGMQLDQLMISPDAGEF